MRDLPPTLHSPAGAPERGGSPPLPGLGAGTNRVAPSPAGAPQRAWGEDHPRLQESGRATAPGPDMAGGDTRAGSLPQAPGPRTGVVPAVWYAVRGAEEAASATPVRSLERAAASALERAAEGDWWRLASPQVDRSNFVRWCVPSRTTPGVFYTVWIRASGAAEWWRKYACNCEAHRSGKYTICWHQAAVHLRQRVASSTR